MSCESNEKTSAFRLVTFDLDGTLFRGNSVLYLKEKLGLSDELAILHSLFSKGKISEAELNQRQIPFLEGIELTSAFEVILDGPMLENLGKGLLILKRSGLEVAMLTFNPLQLALESKFGVNCSLCRTAQVKENRIVGPNDIRRNKVEYLKEYCEKNGIRLDRCVHIGDGPNDVLTFDEVGFSIALNAESKSVREAATCSMLTDDFEVIAKKILEVDRLNASPYCC